MLPSAWLTLVWSSFAVAGEAFEGALLVLTLSLPDGFGDIAFGRCAVEELREIARVTWVRVYSSGYAKDLLYAGLSGLLGYRLVLGPPEDSYEAFDLHLAEGHLDQTWLRADEIFLAPWIFGLGGDGILALSSRLQRPFWALSEYGRGMGNLHGYSSGLGRWVPSGWPMPDTSTGGVFKAILKSPGAGTDWRRHFQDLLGLLEPPRLWWAYGRRDSAHVHAFRLLTAGNISAWPTAVKVIPLGSDGGLAKGVAKTKGDLLRDQIDEVVHDSPRQAAGSPEPLNEVAASSAGQLSHLLVHVLSQPMVGPEVIVAPNAGLQSWAEGDVVRIVSLELVRPDGEATVLDPNREVFLVAVPVPPEDRDLREVFWESTRSCGYRGPKRCRSSPAWKIPFVAPDAKVASWRAALAAAATGIETVPDLGQTLRDLVVKEGVRSHYAEASRRHGEAIQAEIELVQSVKAAAAMRPKEAAPPTKPPAMPPQKEDRRWADEIAKQRRAMAKKDPRQSRQQYVIAASPHSS
eukprot:s1839_g6.t1